MTIGIDIDDTITNSSETIREYAENHFKGEDLDQLLDAPRIDGRLKEFLDANMSKMMKEYTLKDCAKEVIDRLKAKGHTIIIITARGYSVGGDLLNISIDYLRDKGIYYDSIIFKSLEKIEACRENGVDLMIDDAVQNQEKLKENGINVLVFNSKKNARYETSLDRVDTWLEVEAYIDGIGV